ncbi:MAG: PilT/PilU family type 4a pilus ATPase, partial [Candidatus Eremiobacteraeota bacterium]|nr:PilT/PilU family type 4a pilus ATPase [Candidatus Eremiobacteraeota bacterium]
SDVHLGASDRAALRVDGCLVAIDAIVDDASVRAFLEAALTAHQFADLEHNGSADGACVTPQDGGPYRIHAYRHARGLRLAIRLLAERIPSVEGLGLPLMLASFADRTAGLVLFTGPTGCGKSTALAAVIDRINRTSARTIVTIEDPIEYVYRPLRSLITQCEVGGNLPGYAEAVRGFLRADPDVILIGEMRDRDTMAAALTAAETGHLVFSTLHTNDAAQTVDRIVDAFPCDAHRQVRTQLAAVLTAVVALRLVVRRSGGRCAAAELLIATEAVRALIREGKTHQLRNAIVTGRAAGMQTLEAHLDALLLRAVIDIEAARAVSVRHGDLRCAQRAAS